MYFCKTYRVNLKNILKVLFYYIPLLIIATPVFLDKVNHGLKARIGDFHVRIPLDLCVVTFS